MTTKELTKIACREFKWYVHNVCANRAEALQYANKIFDHALECGYITELEHKKLCLSLPFTLNLA